MENFLTIKSRLRTVIKRENMNKNLFYINTHNTAPQTGVIVTSSSHFQDYPNVNSVGVFLFCTYPPPSVKHGLTDRWLLRTGRDSKTAADEDNVTAGVLAKHNGGLKDRTVRPTALHLNV